jgi:RNA polymerase sigma-70 factor (ECF subfamily)
MSEPSQRRDRLAERFEAQRPHLRAVAYRMLGSYAEAEDAVQEAWLRLDRAPEGGIDDLGAWLTTVVARLCLDMLRGRRTRPDDAGPAWALEPVETDDPDHDPEERALLGDSVSLALLVVLESLTPQERVAFVLHDVFAVPFVDIAPIVDRSPTATRQLASRARRRVQGAPVPDASALQADRRVIDAFLAASRAGDFEALLAVLDPDVVFRARSSAALPIPALVSGADAVADQVLAQGTPLAHLARAARVDGGVGVVVGDPAHPVAVVGFTVAEGRIRAIDLYAYAGDRPLRR